MSKWAEAKALLTNNVSIVIDFLKNLFSRFGISQALISDRGSQHKNLFSCYNFNFDILINMSQVNDKFKVYVCSGCHFECINNIPMYLPIDCKIVILTLSVTPEKSIL